jgi:predicted esterase
MRTDTVETSVLGRYWVEDGLGATDSPVLVGFHGYGEDAGALLREVNLIPGVTAWTRIAIQGLHPFYRGRTGEIVASWMTRLDREAAIAHNIRYIATVLERELGARSVDPPLVYLGFSQGTAMAFRAAAGVERQCRAVVALGGDVPPELADGALANLPVVLLGRGTRDEWYTEEKLEDDVRVLRSQGVETRPVRYDGAHEWTDGFRATVGRFLEAMLDDTVD